MPTRNEGEDLPTPSALRDVNDQFRREFSLPEEEETPPFELEEPLPSAEPTAKDYDVLSGPQPGMIRIDDFHLRDRALSLANDFPAAIGTNGEEVVQRAKAYLEFLQGETEKETR